MKRILTAAAFTFALLGAAQAQTTGIATTDLNIRTGPGPEQPSIGFIKAGRKAAILGCVEGSLWCQVNYRGQTGWAYSQYMSLRSGSGQIVVRTRADIAVAELPVVTYDAYGYQAAPTYRADVVAAASPIYNSSAPLVVGAGGPGAGAIGAPRTVYNSSAPIVYNSSAPLVPPAPVYNYVTANPYNSFNYPGTVVVGASLPQTVVLNNVPDYRYQYVYVNDTAVLVDPATRQIVYVFR